MDKGLWILLFAMLSGCGTEQKSEQPDSYAPENKDYFQAPEGYKAKDGAYD